MPLTTYLSSVLQFLLPRSCLCGVAARPWPCPSPLQESACLAYNRCPRCSKAPPPFACLMLSVPGGRSDLRNHQRTLGLCLYQACEHNGGFISSATRCIQVQKPETSALMSCAFNICERQTGCEKHLGPSKPVAPILFNKWMPPPMLKSLPSWFSGHVVRLRAKKGGRPHR